MNNLTVGILAHVDSGKTTLAETILYISGKIKRVGRVDHGDTHLDTHTLERERGITIFSAESTVTTDRISFTLLDTPGHVDFSAEAERTLSVIDYAILVISGSEGVQNHTETLWDLLARYRVPTFIFVNKMDLPSADKSAVMAELCRRLDSACVDFSADADTVEEAVSLLDEGLLEKYLSGDTITDDDMKLLVKERRLFPCCFGSALKNSGVTELLDVLADYTCAPVYGDEFGARVYKISRDERGGRLTHLKIMGGKLAVRTSVTYSAENGEKTEKVTSIRLFSGDRSEAVTEVTAGTVCAVSGLTATYPGQGLGFEGAAASPTLEPVLEYRITLPDGCDTREYYPKLRELTEEDPQLHLHYNERLSEIYVRLMGEVQTEILVRLIKDRFGIDVTVDSGRIMYRETIAAPAVGVGHFEPLRHYAEVHLCLEPTGPGTGLSFRSACSVNALSRNWQRLILSHLRERTHRGVLTGSPITDMRITVIAGRAHPKHTEGGDFRQATYRAVRQALMTARSILLEPYYSYKITVPSQQIGRAMNDVRAMSGTFGTPEDAGDGFSSISGRAPVSAMRNYAAELISYTHGTGKFNFEVCGYYPCHNPEEVIAARGYDPEADLSHTPDSVFCAHGAGFVVKWNHVREYMHLHPDAAASGSDELPSPKSVAKSLKIDDKELEAIMQREFGPIRRPQYGERRTRDYRTPSQATVTTKDTYYIIDGYNVIFAWDSLRGAVKNGDNGGSAELDLARSRLQTLLSSFRAYKGCDMVLVYDAYNVKDAVEREINADGVKIVYTKEGETADAYIERLINKLGKSYNVRVVSSDGLLQLSAISGGVLRMTAREFEAEVTSVRAEITAFIEELDRPLGRDTVLRNIDIDTEEE